MPLNLEGIRFYKKSTVYSNEIIFDQGDDLESYNTNRAWDVLPSHLFRPARKSGGKIKLEFDSSQDADKGLKILQELKSQSK